MTELQHGYCPKCEKHSLLIHLHGEKGGPLLCCVCAGRWQGEHGRLPPGARAAIEFFPAGRAVALLGNGLRLAGASV